MTFHKIAIVSAATLAMAACAPKTQTTTDNTTLTTTAMNSADAGGSAADASSNASDVAPTGGQAFANAAAASDALEIATSKLALDTSKSADIKKFAAKMIDAHTESTAKLKAAAAGASPALTPDPTLTADQQATLDALKTKTGTDFDTAYKTAQVDGHTKTLDALKAYAAEGDVASLKTFASNLVPTVTAHLNMAKGLKG